MQRLLPPLLVLLLLVLMAIADRWLPGPEPVPRAMRVTGLLPVLIGLALTAAARLQFARARTEIHTFREPGSLVADGVFRLSRNPMYLGFALILFGAAWTCGSLAALVLAAAFVVITDRWYIPHEERGMARRFGEAYAVYRARVRRWI